MDLPRINLQTLDYLKQKGFSLVEILVVIAIIGVFWGLALSFTGALQKNTRDAQRESDLRVLQSAIQQFYADLNHYPYDMSTILTNGSALTSCSGEQTPCPSPKIYLSQTPKDPNAPTATYCYYSSQSSSPASLPCDSAGSPGMCHFYELCATLENGTGTAGCTCNPSANLKVTPL